MYTYRKSHTLIVSCSLANNIFHFRIGLELHFTPPFYPFYWMISVLEKTHVKYYPGPMILCFRLIPFQQQQQQQQQQQKCR